MTDENGNDTTHSCYGGNTIPAKWFAEWQRKHGFVREPLAEGMPMWLQQQLEREFGL